MNHHTSMAHINTDNTLVSVIIPAYNAQRFIVRALESALAQDIPRSEIIVVDDASTDGTRDLVATYKTRGVRLLSQARQGGAAAARNAGIAAAAGEFIAFLDADDEWLPGKLKRQLTIMVGAPLMVFISCRATLIDERGEDNGDIYRGALPACGREAWRTLLTYPCVPTPSVVVRRSMLAAAGGFNRWLPVGEDQDMWIRLSMLGQVGHLPEVLVRVHSTPNSLSKTNFREQASYVLPMVAAYVARNRNRLTAGDRRKILAERFGKMGQAAYANGELGFGFTTILRAIGYGHQPLRNFLYFLRASSLAQRLKRWLQSRGSHAAG
jgi:GT2 family glycosyltransferase